MEIRPLTPDMADDYLALFDNSFGDNPEWGGCFCSFYDDPREDGDWDADDPAFAAGNRANRRRTIEEGRAAGLMAYVDWQPAGWVNAAPRGSYLNLRTYAAAVEDDDPPTGSVMCFVIHPDHRGKGIATALLAATDDHFRSLGCEMAEAYPRQRAPKNSDFAWTAAFYKGSESMYTAAGYRPHRQVEHFTVMRKPLT